MRSSVVVALVVAAGLTLAACGSSTKASSPTSTTKVDVLSSPTWEKAGPNPSLSAKMVCQKEAATDIAASVGIQQTRVTPFTWMPAMHILSCTYVYPKGKITVFVKEMSSEKETTAYFDMITKKYGTTQALQGIGQGAWLLKNNDLVARKDYKVLLIDVSGIPAKFAPLMTRSDVALNFGVAIMNCWTGD